MIPTKASRPPEQGKPSPYEFKPTLVNNWTEFEKRYGGLDHTATVRYLQTRYLQKAMYGYFLNGDIVGVPVTSLSQQPGPDSGGKLFINCITALEAYENVTLLACPDVFAVKVKTTTSEVPSGGATATEFVWDDTAIKAIQQDMIEHCKKMVDRMALLDIKQSQKADEAKTWSAGVRDKHAVIYYPWIQLADGLVIPPSGHIAGVFARVDSERGVHKAPANEVIRGADGLEYNMTREELATLKRAAPVRQHWRLHHPQYEMGRL